MKIALASKGNPESVKTWSGIPHYIYRALQKKGHTVSSINLIDPKEPWYFGLYRSIVYKLSKRWFWGEMEPYILKKIAARFDKDVERINPDVVVLIHGHFLAYTTFKQRSIIVHDTTFAQIIEYYADFTKLTTRSINTGNLAYQLGLDRSAAAVFCSSWASDSAITDYQVSPSKVYTIPFGANLSSIPDPENVEGWIRNRMKDESCQFLFLGIEWERKGGPDALQFVAALNRTGIKSFLTIVGCSPDVPDDLQPYVKQMGFLRKDKEDEAEKLELLFRKSTGLLLPSLAECYGCVYCEANAYGLPALGRDTGGVAEIIKDGVNGLLMRTNESPEEFASRWAQVWNDKTAYQEMSINARQEFDERLNYDVFVNKLEEILSQINEEKLLK